MQKKIIQLINIFKKRDLIISVAESCTGGRLSALLTGVSGSSAYFDRGFITYSRQAKIDMLGVQPATLEKFGAVSEQTALEMVKGIIDNVNSDVAVAITGIAGPTGGTKAKPVGMVCFGFCILNQYFSYTQHFKDDRIVVMQAAIDFVIETLNRELS